MYPIYFHLREMALLYSHRSVFFPKLRVTEGRKAPLHVKNSKDHDPVHEIPSLRPFPRPQEFRTHIIPYYPETIYQCQPTYVQAFHFHIKIVRTQCIHVFLTTVGVSFVLRPVHLTPIHIIALIIMLHIHRSATNPTTHHNVLHFLKSKLPCSKSG